jgi:trehalose 6-phosphate phosphatase
VPAKFDRAEAVYPGMTSLTATPEMQRDSCIGVDEALRMVDCQNAALFLDVDGTLLDLAARPDAVFVPDGLVAILARATRNLKGALALVSGRTIDDIDRLFAPLSLRASGVHGAQIRIHPDEPIRIAPAASELPVSFRTALGLALSRFQGILIENKGFSIAVHYRLNPEIAGNLLGALRDMIAAEPWRGLEIEDAHYAFELKPPSFDKGKAIAHFLACAPFRGRTPIFIGDDTTDESGFAAVAARGGQAYSVGRPRTGALGFFEAPQTVRDWLAAFADAGEGE